MSVTSRGSDTLSTSACDWSACHADEVCDIRRRRRRETGRERETERERDGGRERDGERDGER
jgi:hypothetical protein